MKIVEPQASPSAHFCENSKERKKTPFVVSCLK